MRRSPGSLVLLLCLAAPAFGAPPPPLTSSVYDFPGSFASPGSALSASLGMADSWLGDEPFENPAVLPERGFHATPILYHMSRQDLRGLNRSVSEQSAFFDGAGAWIGARVGRVGLFAYGNQPVLRREENAYLTGPLSGSPAPVENSATAREMRAGLGVSVAWRALRFGVAGEWTQRNDSYSTVDKSGSPLAGSSAVNFSGGALGGQAGARLELGPAAGAGHVTVGASLRWVPELKVDGDQSTDVGGFKSSTVSATRGSGVESGLGIRYAPTEQVHVMGGIGVRTTQEWRGFGVTHGGGDRWALGVDFHDARDPWTVRFGLGQEAQRGAAEPRAGDVGLGLGWKVETTMLDFALARRTFAHLGGATSYEDRALVGVSVPF